MKVMSLNELKMKLVVSAQVFDKGGFVRKDSTAECLFFAIVN